jgi:hypothetical protein
MTAASLPVVAVKVTVGDGRDRAVVGWLPSEGWWCDVHGKRRCAHVGDALAWLAREHEGAGMRAPTAFGRCVVEVSHYTSADAAWARLSASCRDPRRAWLRQGPAVVWWLRNRAEDHVTADRLIELLGYPTDLSTSRGGESS